MTEPDFQTEKMSPKEIGELREILRRELGPKKKFMDDEIQAMADATVHYMRIILKIAAAQKARGALSQDPAGGPIN